MISLKTLKRNNTCIQQVDENVIFLIFFTCLTEFGSGQVLISILRRTFQLLVKLSCQIINLETVLCMFIDRQFEKGRKKSEEC